MSCNLAKQVQTLQKKQNENKAIIFEYTTIVIRQSQVT